jgi:hypothetical protein
MITCTCRKSLFLSMWRISIAVIWNQIRLFTFCGSGSAFFLWCGSNLSKQYRSGTDSFPQQVIGVLQPLNELSTDPKRASSALFVSLLGSMISLHGSILSLHSPRFSFYITTDPPICDFDANPVLVLHCDPDAGSQNIMRVLADPDQQHSFLPVMEEGFVADITPADAHLGDIAIKLLIKYPASQNLLYNDQFWGSKFMESGSRSGSRPWTLMTKNKIKSII